MGDNGFVLQLASTGPTPLPQPQHELPPLILHPIADQGEALQVGTASDTEGRQAEVRRLEMKMLCCLGKDLTRWLEQCLEFAAADPALAALSAGHFMDVLVDNPPDKVARKMQAWGVAEFRMIFARALGLATIFPHPPASNDISDTFIRDFSRYASVVYRTRRATLPPSTAETPELRFEVYASGEYAQLLEKSWGL